MKIEVQISVSEDNKWYITGSSGRSLKESARIARSGLAYQTGTPLRTVKMVLDVPEPQKDNWRKQLLED